MVSCLHCYVAGRVQGVWFRQSTLEQARSLGLVGWVRNLPDGRVECLACGPEAALEALRAWLHEGPPLARVTEVVCRPAPCPEPMPTAFRIRR